MDCSLPGSSVHGIFEARILERVAISLSRRSCQPRDWTYVSCIGRQIIYGWATREAPGAHTNIYLKRTTLLIQTPLSGPWSPRPLTCLLLNKLSSSGSCSNILEAEFSCTQSQYQAIESSYANSWHRVTDPESRTISVASGHRPYWSLTALSQLVAVSKRCFAKIHILNIFNFTTEISFLTLTYHLC